MPVSQKSTYVKVVMTGSPKVVCNIVMSYVGAGVLGLPFGFLEAGLLLGIGILAFVCLCVIYAMHILVDCKNRTRSMILADPGKTITHSDIAHLAFGYPGELIMNGAIIMSQLGFSSAYLLFITDNLASVVPSVNRLQWIAFLLPNLYLLTFVKNLERFVVFSFLSQVANLVAFFVILWFDYLAIGSGNQVKTPPTPKSDLLSPLSLSGVFMFYSICIYSFEGSGLILSLENSGDETTRAKFKWNFSMSMLSITSFYVVFGALGFVAFGDATNQIITFNLPPSNGFDYGLLVKLCLCFSLFFSYPLMLHPLSAIFEDKFQQIVPGAASSYILKLIFVGSTALVIIVLPNFADLLEILGSICCTLLAFIIPSMAHLKFFYNEMSCKEKCLDLGLCLVGTFTVVAGIVDTARKLAQ